MLTAIQIEEGDVYATLSNKTVTFSDPPQSFTKEQVDRVLLRAQQECRELGILDLDTGKSKDFLSKVRFMICLLWSPEATDIDAYFSLGNQIARPFLVFIDGHGWRRGSLRDDGGPWRFFLGRGDRVFLSCVDLVSLFRLHLHPLALALSRFTLCVLSYSKKSIRFNPMLSGVSVTLLLIGGRQAVLVIGEVYTLRK